jgi:hypothetical protein
MKTKDLKRLERSILKRVVEREGGCWELPGGTPHPCGTAGGGKVRLRRVAYGMKKGRAPLGRRSVVSTCNNPRCLNPAHLKAGPSKGGGPGSPARGVAQRRYPWRRWFKMGKFVLRKGVDYDVSSRSMAQMLRNNASSIRALISLRVTDESVRGVLRRPPCRPQQGRTTWA